MRKHHIDNLRWICVLLLFPYHTFMVFNSFGESFYVKGPAVVATSYVIGALSPWIMPLMFLIAGVSSAYSLERRTTREYLEERTLKLLVPLIFGVLLLVPLQTFVAEVFHNGYRGGYLRQYVLFFTKPTDLSGYGGGFTLAHLWFLLYLFVISLAATPLMALYRRMKKKPPVQKTPYLLVMLLFLIPGVTQMFLDFDGKSVGEYAAWFLIGYFIIADEEVQKKVEKYRFVQLAIAVPFMFVFLRYGWEIEVYNNILYEFVYFIYVWAAIQAALGFGRRHLNSTNRAATYLTRNSFGLYLLHQQWTVVAAYFTLMWVRGIPLQMLVIILASAALTFVNLGLFKRFSVTCFMFGLKKD